MAIDLTGINSSIKANDAQAKDLQQNQPLQTGPASDPGGNGEADQESAGQESDSVTLTQAASVLQDLQKTLSSLPVVDRSRVASVQNAISNGSFEIDSNRIAEKMLAFEQSLATDL
ncbi:MAG: flagellar biosynthesis anti-sigma factor FlgM [Gammaproteobacteria bacterium]|nr:MAG: flagellar biosynthesis anti-sigma factor FlgM [Gammaproteobacteria bacterium]